MTGTFAKYGGIGGSYYSTSESFLSLCIPLPLILPSSRAVYTHNYILKAGGCLLKKILFKNCSSFWSFDRYVNISLLSRRIGHMLVFVPGQFGLNPVEASASRDFFRFGWWGST